MRYPLRSHSCTRRAIALAAMLACASAAAPSWAAPRTGDAAAKVPADLRAVVALQVALDASGMSPGLIDGLTGPKTQEAVEAFQRARGLPVTGKPDEATRRMLALDEDTAIATYEITAADRKDVGRVPDDWNEKSRLDRLPYRSLAELVGERFHCHQRLLARLNPDADLASLKVGDQLLVPNVRPAAALAPIARLEVNLGEKIIRAYGADRKLVAMFHCSIPAKREKYPSGNAQVVGVAENPVYRFDPDMWPEVRSVKRVLDIPPGPRNPVGIRWIALSKPGVGIHGTPNPELIGKTGSHGCIRLTNWDAVRLAGMVRPGLPVEFIGPEGSARVAAASDESR